MISITAATAAHHRTLLRQCCRRSSMLGRQRLLMSSSSSSISSTTTPTDEERPRRSLFSVPGADIRKIIKSQTLNADSVVLDLEDGVSWNQKDQARDLVRNTLLDEQQTFGRSELCVRINGLDAPGSLAVQDLEAILPCPRLQTIVIPKVESASDIHFIHRMINSFCSTTTKTTKTETTSQQQPQQRDIRILAAIESAKGILNLSEIAASSSSSSLSLSGGGTTSTSTTSRLDGLIFASEDYCADLEAIRTESATELLYARSQLVITAKAYGLQAIDMVHINFRDLDGLQKECQHGRELGFTGKQAIHPNQIDMIHTSFAPSIKDITFARKAMIEYEATTALGKGACEVDGIVVDQPVYKWAMKIIHRASSAGLLDG